jgi:4-amino-4-deoxy-L-arabinose transferase-like glycosyltransferase
MWRTSFRQRDTDVPGPLLGRDGIRRLLIVGAAAVLAVAGIVALEQSRGNPGQAEPDAFVWALFAAAGVLVAVANGSRRSIPIMPAESLLGRVDAHPRGRVVVVAASVSMVSAAASIPLFRRLNDVVVGTEPAWLVNDGSWLLYAVSLFALGVAILAWESTNRSARPDVFSPRRRWLEPAAVGVLLVVALAVRLIQLNVIPHGLWFDEAENGLVAMGLAKVHAFHAVFISQATEMGAIYFYVLGGLQRVFGESIFMLRVLPAIAGALTVPLLYVLAARLYGRRVAAVSAALLAFSAWNITFSRFGLASMATVALDVAVYTCIVLGLRSGRLGWYAGGGALLGLGLQGYYVARLVPLVLLALLVHIAIGDWRKAWALRSGIAIFAAAAAIAFTPMAVFAVQKPDEFNSRISSVSVFSEEDDTAALEQSVRAHLLMFNYRGDQNGRHNDPGSPMLDWITGTLFLVGLAVCVVRVRCWQYFFPLAWFVASLSGGVLSLLFEAPQAHRTLENSVVTALVAGIALGEVWDAVARSSTRYEWRLATTGLVAALVAVAIGLNLHKYFVRQARDTRVWVEMGVADEAAGRVTARYGGSNDIWVADVIVNTPVMQFLAPHVPELVWRGERTLPLEGTRGRGSVIVLPVSAELDVAALARLYPRAAIAALTPPEGGKPFLYTVAVTSADIRALRGVVARGLSGSPIELMRFALTRRLERLGKEASLVSTLKVPASGSYRFRWPSVGWNSVRIDGMALRRGQPVRLGQGLHRLDARVAPLERAGRSELLWHWAASGQRYTTISPTLLFDPRGVPPRGLVGQYRWGRSFAGPPTQLLIDPQIAMQFHVPPVGPPFTVDWDGELYVPKTGEYGFGTEQIDTATLFIDGRTIVDNGQGNTLMESSVALERGWHRVRLRYRGVTGNFHVYLYWTPPGATQEVVPADFLRPRGAGGWPYASSPRRVDADGDVLQGRLVQLSEDGGISASSS